MIYNQWYAILPSKKIKKGKLLGIKRLNMELVIFRDENNNLGCVSDKCSHRGTALSAGKVNHNCIQCPFHGFEFDKDGKCKFIPANGKSSTSDLTRYNVKTYLVREAHDIIYFWYGDDGLESKELPFFENELPDDMVYSELEDHWNSHYSRSIENQLDAIHLPFVHYNTIGRGNKTLVNGPNTFFKDDILFVYPNNELDQNQKPMSYKDSPMKSTYLCFKFPNVWVNHITPRIKVFAYFVPVDNDNTIMYIRFYTNQYKLKLINNIFSFTGKLSSIIIEKQDKRIVVTQKPKASSFSSRENLIAGDRPIVLYRKQRDELKNKNEI